MYLFLHSAVFTARRMTWTQCCRQMLLCLMGLYVRPSRSGIVTIPERERLLCQTAKRIVKIISPSDSFLSGQQWHRMQVGSGIEMWRFTATG